jgi:hypothetical protein
MKTTANNTIIRETYDENLVSLAEMNSWENSHMVINYGNLQVRVSFNDYGKYIIAYYDTNRNVSCKPWSTCKTRKSAESQIKNFFRNF